MRIINDPKLDFDSVLIVPKRSASDRKSRAEIPVERSFRLKWDPFPKNNERWSGVPIFAANMDTVGTLAMHEALAKHKISTALHKHVPEDLLVESFTKPNPYLWYSLGITKEDKAKFNRVKNLVGEKQINVKNPGKWHNSIQYICIDVANGYTEAFVDFVAQMRKENSGAVIMAGNVVTPEITQQLLLAGADIVKVGIGPGSVCTTRKMTGVGYPQLSAIIECADAAHGMDGLICADGGCRVPGDVSKAFGAGADFVMLGGMLAGTAESGGTVIEVDGKKKVEYYGMSSYTAQDKYSDKRHEYRASEGKRVLLPYKGPVEGVVTEILGGIRSACMYTGAPSLKQLSKCTTFALVTQQRNTVFDQFDTE